MRLIFLCALFAMSPASAAPFIVAHRGASKDAPENTLPAFELAWKQKADAVEGDFHLTKDGRIVCFHDPNTEKITGKKLTIAECTLRELQSLDVGSWRGEHFAGLRMPTLDEVLTTVPEEKVIYIEIKCGPEIVPALLQSVAESNLKSEQVVVISFDARVIAAVKKARPEWTANWLYSFDKRVPDAPQRDLPKVIKTLKSIRADGLGSNSHPGITKTHLHAVRSSGVHHHVWTVNEVKTARRFLAMGTRSVTTDIPGRLRSELASGE